jgi:hypothetical protein
MNKNLSKNKYLILITILFFCFCTFSCGTILYPERKGQISGKIDPGVAVLNGIGLLFFLIPGVIAFAVDFSNGTIYLPETSSFAENDKFDPDKVKIIKTQKKLTPGEIERLLKKHTGKDIDFELAQIINISN